MPEAVVHEPDLQLVMSLAQAMSHSNPEMASALLAAQHPQYHTSQQPPQSTTQAHMLLQQLQHAQNALAQSSDVLASLSAREDSALAAAMLPSSAAPHALPISSLHTYGASPPPHSHAVLGTAAKQDAASGTMSVINETACYLAMCYVPQYVPTNRTTLLKVILWLHVGAYPTAPVMLEGLFVYIWVGTCSVWCRCSGVTAHCYASFS